MYRLLYDQRTLFDPYGDDDEVVSDASLSMESNASSYLDFTISAKHPLYDVVAEREGVVRLYSDDALLFEGIIESIETDLELNKAIGCISALEYLNDSVVRPYSTVAGEEDLTAPSSVAGYFQWLIDQHNEHVLDTSKQFKIGVNQGSALKDSDYVYYSSSSYPTTASELTTNVIDAYGGYLFLRYENGLKVLDLYADVRDMNAQVVDFGVNITDFTKTVDTKDQCTALVVQGGPPTFVNGDFEDRTNNWEVFPGTEAATGVVHSGTYSSHFTEGYGEYVNSSFFYLKPGWRYKSIAWVKNERSSDVVIRAFYQTENGGSWVNYSCGGTDSLTVPNDGEWHEFTVDFLPNGSENAKIRPRWIFDYVSNDGGRVYVDDFDFTRIDGEDSVAEDPIDLTLIPNGVSNIDEDVVKNGDAIYSTSYVARYGYKETTYNDDSLTTLDELMRQGVVQLRKIMAPTITLDVKAVDLALFMEGYEHLQVGQAVRVRSVPHDVDEYLMVSSIDLDLQNPGQTEYVFGASYDSLTGQQSGYLKSLNAGINASLDTVSSLDQTVKDQAVQIGSVERIANDAKDTANNAQNTADNAAKTATNFLKFDSAGLCVGDMTSGTLGYNTLIKSTGMDIRNGSAVLASFTPTEIALGKNSSSSSIDLCNGLGKIKADQNYANALLLQGKNSGVNVSIGDNSRHGIIMMGGSNGYLNLQGNALILSGTDSSAPRIFKSQYDNNFIESKTCELQGFVEIYSSSTLNFSNTITLYEPASEFKMLEVFYGDNDGWNINSSRVWVSHNKRVICWSFTYVESLLFIKMTSYLISGAKLTAQEYLDWSVAAGSVTPDNRIGVYRVLGWF